MLRSCPLELRVRVQIAGRELTSIATGADSAWSGIATVTRSQPENDQFGRTGTERVNLRVPISSVAEGDMPDNRRIGVMFPSDTSFKEWRIASFSRVASVLFTIALEPLNG
jgi:hypothetical protein